MSALMTARDVTIDLGADGAIALRLYVETNGRTVAIRRVNMTPRDCDEGLDVVGGVWRDDTRPLGVGVSIGLEHFAEDWGYAASLDVIGHARALLGVTS
jgi:hypothetical protein